MDPKQVRDAVADAYKNPVPLPGAAKLAGYTESDFAAVPDGVVISSFGCGNPLSYVRVQPGETVLDLGSGAGFDLILAGRAVGEAGRVIGVDMTPAMIERARSNVARTGMSNIEIRQGLIEELPVDSGSVDWVISNCVISLSPQKDRVFREIARVLKPGGRMLISDIVVDRQLGAIAKRSARFLPEVGHVRTEPEYLELMADAGLRDPHVEDRLVYEVDDLVGILSETATRAFGDWPVVGAVDRYAKHAISHGALRLAARAVSGRVWSAKFAAQRALR